MAADALRLGPIEQQPQGVPILDARLQHSDKPIQRANSVAQNTTNCSELTPCEPEKVSRRAAADAEDAVDKQLV